MKNMNIASAAIAAAFLLAFTAVAEAKNSGGRVSYGGGQPYQQPRRQLFRWKRVFA